MPIDLVSASGFICEKLLREEDGVNSAIRIVDIFYVEVPEPKPNTVTLGLIAFNVVIILRTLTPGHASIRFFIRTPSGEDKPVSAQVPEPLVFAPKVPNAPFGHTLNVNMNIVPDVFGTYTFLAQLDGKTVVSLPFTLLRGLPPASQS